jgi:DnaK suppressor protein
MSKKNKESYSLESKAYMNEAQLEYFKQKLLTWKEELEYELQITKNYLQQEEKNEADLYNRVTREIHIARELGNKERYRQLIHKIN